MAQNIVTPPDPEAKFYFNYFEQQSHTPETWNYKRFADGTRTVQLAGKLLVLDSADTHGIFASLGAAEDIKRLDIYADTLVVRRAIRLPGTEVHIHAEQLRFEDVDGAPVSVIDTSPLPPPGQAAPGVAGMDGMAGGDIYVAAKDYFSAGNRAPRFLLNGGDGQAGGAGSNGEPGNSVTLLSAAKPRLIGCASNGRRMSNGTPWLTNPLGAEYPYVYEWALADPGLSFAELQTQVVDLSADFPTDGKPATAGGRPGSGGRSGSLHNPAGMNLWPYAQSSPGHAGKSAGSYTGGAAGTPTSAIRVSLARCDDESQWVTDGNSVWLMQITYLNIQGVTRRTIQRGADAVTPPADRAVGTAGSAMSDLGTFAWYHPHAVAMTLKFAEDAFANGFRDLASAELTKHDALLQQLQQSPDWAALSAEDRTLFTQYSLRVRSLVNQLASHEDYWGNPQNWVPELSLEANLALYQQEVQWAIRTIFVSDWLTDKNNAVKDKVAAIGQAKSLLKAEIDQQQAQLDAAIARLPGLKQDASNASDALDGFQAQLRGVEQRLTDRATRNVQDRLKLPFWKKALKVLFIAAEALPVPAVQPYLSGAAKTLDSLINFNSDQPWDSLTKVVDAVKTFKSTDIDKKAQDVKDKSAQQKPQDKGTIAELQATVAEIQKYVGPVVDALKKQKASFSDQEVKKDDLDKQIAAELEKLKGEDAEYQQLEANLKSVMDTRNQLVKSISDTTTALEQASTKISEYWLQYSALLPQVSGQVANIASQRSQIALTDLRAKALRRLQKYQYLLSRAYKYRMLRDYPGDLTLTDMFNEMLTLIRATGQNGVLQAADYDHLYALYRADISAIIEAVVDEYAHGQRRYDTVSVNYDLSSAELARLNSGSTVELNFWERGAFQPGDEDVRIVKLEVTDMQADQVGTGDFAYVDLDTVHPGISRVWRDGQVSVFQHYSKSTLQPLHWATRLQNGALTQFVPSASSASLLRALIPDASTDIMLFSRPSAWAPLAMRKLVHGTNGVDFTVRSARVRLTYDFTTRTSGITWPQYRDSQNATANTLYQSLLNRPGTADELSAARSLLDMGYTNDATSSVLRQTHEQEFYEVHVVGIYGHLYQRTPTDVERSFWAKELMNGRPEAQVINYVRTITSELGSTATLDDLERRTSLLDQDAAKCPGTRIGDSIALDLVSGTQAKFTLASTLAANCNNSRLSGTVSSVSDPLTNPLAPVSFTSCATTIGFAATLTTNSVNGSWGLWFANDGHGTLHIPQGGAVLKYATATATIAPTAGADIPVAYDCNAGILTIDADIPTSCAGVLCPRITAMRLQASYKISH